MWVLPSHEINVVHRLACVSWKWRGPDDVRGAVAEQINNTNRRQVIDAGKLGQDMRLAQTIAGLVKEEFDPPVSEIDDIGRARPI